MMSYPLIDIFDYGNILIKLFKMYREPTSSRLAYVYDDIKELFKAKSMYEVDDKKFAINIFNNPFVDKKIIVVTDGLTTEHYIDHSMNAILVDKTEVELFGLSAYLDDLKSRVEDEDILEYQYYKNRSLFEEYGLPLINHVNMDFTYFSPLSVSILSYLVIGTAISIAVESLYEDNWFDIDTLIRFIDGYDDIDNILSVYACTDVRIKDNVSKEKFTKDLLTTIAENLTYKNMSPMKSMSSIMNMVNESYSYTIKLIVD